MPLPSARRGALDLHALPPALPPALPCDTLPRAVRGQAAGGPIDFRTEQDEGAAMEVRLSCGVAPHHLAGKLKPTKSEESQMRTDGLWQGCKSIRDADGCALFWSDPPPCLPRPSPAIPAGLRWIGARGQATA